LAVEKRLDGLEATGRKIPQSPGFPGLKKDAERVRILIKGNNEKQN